MMHATCLPAYHKECLFIHMMYATCLPAHYLLRDNFPITKDELNIFFRF